MHLVQINALVQPSNTCIKVLLPITAGTITMHIINVVGEPILKKCVIKGDNLSVTGTTKKLYILNAGVVLMTVWGAVCLDLWAIYRLP